MQNQREDIQSLGEQFAACPRKDEVARELRHARRQGLHQLLRHQNNRILLRGFFTKWVAWRGLVRKRLSRMRAVKYLLRTTAVGLLRVHYRKWVMWLKGRVARRLQNRQKYSTLSRQTQRRLRVACFQKWMQFVVLRRRQHQHNRTQLARLRALRYLEGSHRKGLLRHYFGLWKLWRDFRFMQRFDYLAESHETLKQNFRDSMAQINSSDIATQAKLDGLGKAAAEHNELLTVLYRKTDRGRAGLAGLLMTATARTTLREWWGAWIRWVGLSRKYRRRRRALRVLLQRTAETDYIRTVGLAWGEWYQWYKLVLERRVQRHSKAAALLPKSNAVLLARFYRLLFYYRRTARLYRTRLRNLSYLAGVSWRRLVERYYVKWRMLGANTASSQDIDRLVGLVEGVAGQHGEMARAAQKQYSLLGRLQVDALQQRSRRRLLAVYYAKLGALQGMRRQHNLRRKHVGTLLQKSRAAFANRVMGVWQGFVELRRRSRADRSRKKQAAAMLLMHTNRWLLRLYYNKLSLSRRIVIHHGASSPSDLPTPTTRKKKKRPSKSGPSTGDTSPVLAPAPAPSLRPSSSERRPLALLLLRHSKQALLLTYYWKLLRFAKMRRRRRKQWAKTSWLLRRTKATILREAWGKLERYARGDAIHLRAASDVDGMVKALAGKTGELMERVGILESHPEPGKRLEQRITALAERSMALEEQMAAMSAHLDSNITPRMKAMREELHQTATSVREALSDMDRILRVQGEQINQLQASDEKMVKELAGVLEQKGLLDAGLKSMEEALARIEAENKRMSELKVASRTDDLEKALALVQRQMQNTSSVLNKLIDRLMAVDEHLERLDSEKSAEPPPASLPFPVLGNSRISPPRSPHLPGRAPDPTPSNPRFPPPFETPFTRPPSTDSRAVSEDDYALFRARAARKPITPPTAPEYALRDGSGPTATSQKDIPLRRLELPQRTSPPRLRTESSLEAPVAPPAGVVKRRSWV
eukprot:Sspe_Gene.6244::Locus_2113_Transcript_1_1_Confidence_1.000_Length_3472::g.6244::m.6244